MSELGVRIVRGVASTGDQDAVVLILRGPEDARCTATMIAPNLALTARHCVSDADSNLSCKLSGEAEFGGATRDDYTPADLRFYRGTTQPAEPSARGARIIHDRAGNLCAHDLALVLLDRALDTPVATIRRDAEPRPGEAIRVIGWGLTQDSPETLATVRQQRDANVISVGPKQTDQFLTLTPADFSVGESICSGDSGGPVIARDTGAVIGVISHADSCFGPGEYNVMTKLAPFRAVIDEGFAAAGASPRLEVRDDDEGGFCDCRVGGDATDAMSAVLVSAFFLWARRRRLVAR